MHEITDPYRNAIDEHEALCSVTLAKRRHEIKRRLAGLPCGVAPVAMDGDALLHLLIDCFGGRDIGSLLRVLRQLLGMAALARSRTA